MIDPRDKDGKLAMNIVNYYFPNKVDKRKLKQIILENNGYNLSSNPSYLSNRSEPQIGHEQAI